MFGKKMLTPICFALTAWAAVESGTHFRRTLENTGRKERIHGEIEKESLESSWFSEGRSGRCRSSRCENSRGAGTTGPGGAWQRGVAIREGVGCRDRSSLHGSPHCRPPGF